jgi:hypothetical protein
MTAAELSARRPVWYALSRLYLDAELDDGDLRQIAAALAPSPYSVAEIRDIDLWEVAPVVYPLVVGLGGGGVWTGFDEEWIHAECEKRARRRGLLLRLVVALGFRRFVHRITGPEWARLGALIESARADARSG